MSNDNVIQIDSRTAYMENMARYSLYILYDRYTPDIRDGLKPVQRRIIYAMWNDIGAVSIGTKRKSANTTGTVMAKYHPHGDSGSYGAMKALTNWFEIKIPLINYDSNSGSIQGGPQAASRYTESYLSKFAMDCVIGELQEVKDVVDWQRTFDNHTIEPECLPVKVPLLLVNGCFGIAIGSRIESPKHSLNDVIDATIDVLHDPKAKVVLIPDPCQKCEIIDTDWKKISNTGYGYYIERGIINIEHNNKTGTDILHILSTPDLIFYDSIAEKIENLIKDKKLVQIADIQDHSTENQLDIHIILKRGSDPNYVKQVLYKNTPLQDTKRINMQVINETDVSRISYKAYISYFLEFRRSVKFRLYNFRLQKAETRLHQLDTYIKILESGDVENIIKMIRNQSSMDEGYLVEWLMKKLKITDLQAKFVLHTEIGRLSKGHLNKYKEEQSRLFADVNNFINIITNEKLIDQEIERELLEIKAKYGKPRQSILISESEASNIPEGEFKIVITEQNYVKKLQINEPIKVVKGDNPKCIVIADNSKDILLFDQMGKVFRLPVHKIAFTDKNSPGLDIRLILKKLTSNIISVMYLPILEHLQNKSSKYFVVTVSKNGLIKRMDIDDVINATPSGIIYSKLNQNDQICDILIANQKSDIVVYTKSKALRMPIEQIPYLKRSTLGNQAMKTTETIDGISVVTSDTKDVVVVTAKGRFNKISQAAFERSDRNKAGSKVIKLNKGDYIMNIFPCTGNNVIRVVRADEVLEIETDSIPYGSSVSQGVKLCKDGVIKAELIKR
jgi:DNA gyrase subunit A